MFHPLGYSSGMTESQLPEPKLSEYVNAVMLTGRTRQGQNFAHGAIRCFLEQSYRDRHLIILNQDPRYLYMEDDYPGINEIQVSPKLSRGDMWRLAADYAPEGWLMSWPDDCWHHPHRMVFQMAHRRGMATANVVRSMLVVDTENNNVGVDSSPSGHPDTLLIPSELFKHQTFDPAVDDPEKHYFEKYFVEQQQYTVTENEPDTWPGSALCIRMLYEGTDILPAKRDAIIERMNLNAVTADHSALLAEIFPDFYQIGVAVRQLD